MSSGVAVAVLAGVLAVTVLLGLVLRTRGGRARTSRGGTVADLAAPDQFGERATLIQFSTPTCARCPSTARRLDRLAAEHPGVRRLEIDLEEHRHLIGRFDVRQTPTVLVVDRRNAVRTQISGVPREPELVAALHAVLNEE